MRSRGFLAGVVVAIAGCCLALGAGQASASHVDCGDEITADTTLDSDLVECPNHGIVIGADDVTLDLDGHRIEGDGTPFAGCGPRELCDAGVLNDGHDEVTVRDGAVRQFGSGVIVFSARHNRVLDISSSRHDFFGLAVVEVARSVVRDSSLSHNIAPDGDGMGIFFGSHHIRIMDTSFRNNPGPGIHIEDSTDNLIKGNFFSRNGPGILLEARRNQVRRNHIVRDGVAVRGNRNVIAHNRASRGGIGIEGGRANLVVHNVVTDGRGAGIRLGFDGPERSGGGNNVVRRNLVRGSGGDGFVVAEKDDHSVLKRNRVVGAEDDGFDVNSGSTRLTSNRANRNGDLGIEAVAGVIDGGGNRASGNGDPAQCTNVACR